MLSDSEIAQYHERGYVFPDFKLPADTLAEIAPTTTACSPAIRSLG